jgi:uncharacterized protein YcfL
MRKLVVVFISSLVLIACSGKKKVPEGVLPVPKMQEVLWDMIKAGEFLNNFVIFKDTTINRASESQKWYDKVYEVHKISKEQFDKSYAFYQAHPEMMKEMLDSLAKKPAPAATAAVKNNTGLPDSVTRNLTTDSIYKLKAKMLKIDTAKKARLRSLTRPD